MKKADYELLSAFRYTLRRYLRTAEIRGRNVGLTPQQYQALLSIKGFPNREEANIGEIAERLQSEHHSVVELVNRLEARGLVTRTVDSENRRRVYVRLTSRGDDALEIVASANMEELKRLAPEIIAALNHLVNPA